MTLDLGLLAFLGLFGVMGLFSGGRRQLSQWIGLALAYGLGRPIAAKFAPAVAQKLGLPGTLAPLGVTLLLLIPIYVLAAAASRALFGMLLPSGEKTKMDRLAGLALGAAKGAALAFVALSAAASFEKPLEKAGLNLGAKTSGSAAAAFTRKHNPFGTVRLPALEEATQLAAASADPKIADDLLRHPAVQAALADPRVKAAMKDPGVQEALRSKNPSALLANPQIKRLLEDPELAKKLEEFQAGRRQ